ncbi:hypothetical protein [Gimesia fumaroli]|uniref:Carboxypeptidase regulatory-like domain-containing protein n=1 Tax=Gimesia fumaroli TaxID=2527976 RepID=A0A518ILL0_9PLAN|nr:hypothetical protein [Gimesia fumaroli]QDV53967.1 hypothetical protein Enr17x_60500 [Gimesia fumaroli]
MTTSILQHVRQHWLRLGIAVCLICLLAGCGGAQAETKSMGTISGSVTLKGKPLTDCRINFISEQIGSGAGGDLQSGGSFTLDGPIPAGKYSVFITMPEVFTPTQAQSKSGLSSVPKKYHSQSTTDLKADVKEGENNLQFDLK